ncbi:MAG TPA: class I SAM-dependent methyltransferase [Candidatus Saccharimonadia bacterium]|nr:class I SAM-dependent methyltransferase [Candidatus Saccharimonadia bacterium]
MAKFILNLDGPLVSLPTKIQEYPFDHVTRYRIIAEIIVRYEKYMGHKPRNILDVGGLGSFLDQIIDVPITILDSEADNSGNEQQGDGSHMTTIADGSYDIVITSDTLEHIPRSDRKLFIKELFRVSNDLVILCAPFGDHGAAKKETLVQRVYSSLFNHPHRWLQEHDDLRIPTETETLPEIEKYAKSVAMVRHNDVVLWADLMTAALLAHDIGVSEISKAALKLNKFYNNELMFKDFTDKNYRTFFVASKQHEIDYSLPKSTIGYDDRAKLNELLADFHIAVFEHKEQLPGIREKLHEQAREVDRLASAYEQVIYSKTWRYTQSARSALRTARKTIGKRQHMDGKG